MSSLADRIKIASKGKGREVIPSVQDVINCGDAGNCQGGDPNAANAWVHKSGGVPDVTCQQYQAKNMNCTAENRCQNCAGWNCYGVPLDLVPMIQVEEYTLRTTIIYMCCTHIQILHTHVTHTSN